MWQGKDWPNFKWKSDLLLEALGRARKAQGQILAQAEWIGLETQANLLIEEAFTTSAIEGEQLDRNTIRSSVARRLGLPIVGLSKEDRQVEGLIEMLVDATSNFQSALTSKRLQGWQAALFPTGYSGIHQIKVGGWRVGSEPMRVISESLEKEEIHFEAPPSERVPKEMKRFLSWWETSSRRPHGHRDGGFDGSIDGLMRAGIAHLWFVTIHPFDDGNGRVARAITDMALAQDEGTGQRLYSLSMQIIRDRKEYYEILEKTQKKDDCDITKWLNWFLNMFTRALGHSGEIIQKALLVAKFWQKRSRAELNERQLKIIQKLLEYEPAGFEGGLTNRKYVSLTKASRETAKRDLADLEKKGFLKKNEGLGRSVSYSLVIQ